MKYIDIVVNDIPGQPVPEFVEVENDEGKSIRIGEWVRREDGTRALRIKPEDLNDSR